MEVARPTIPKVSHLAALCSETSISNCMASCSSSALRIQHKTLSWTGQRTEFLGDCTLLRSKAPRMVVSKPAYTGQLAVRSYLETTNPVSKFISSVGGAIPIFGLISRLVSDEGGVGAQRLSYLEFCRRVENAATPKVSKAFTAFAERHGKAARTSYILLWCWQAAVGAGLLKSEDILAAAGRLRVSYDLQYEVDNAEVLMDEATQKRMRARKKEVVVVPMAARAEKALQAICKCCINSQRISREDGELLITILCGVYLSLERDEVEELVAARIAIDESAGALEEDGQVMEGEREDDMASADVDSAGVTSGTKGSTSQA